MTALTTRTTRRRSRLAALLLGASLSVTGVVALVPAPAGAAPVAAVAPAAGAPVTNLAHLDFLLDRVTVPAVPGHTTYALADDPELTMPWTYADARPGGTFQRIGGGFDPATGTYAQGAFNSDDITRAAVVYLRDWQVNHRAASRDKAYQLLRSVAYFQTVTGGNAGHSVLWMQPDGTLNPARSRSSCPTRRTPARATGKPGPCGPSARGTPRSGRSTRRSPASCSNGSGSAWTRSTARSSTATATGSRPTASGCPAG